MESTLLNEFNPPVTLVSNNSTTASTTVSRRRAVFTNNTGQTIRLTTTFMGGNSRTATLTRGQNDVILVLSTAAARLGHIATATKMLVVAGGSSDATVAGIFADVTAQIVTTTNPNAATAVARDFSGNIVTSGNNIGFYYYSCWRCRFYYEHWCVQW